MRVAGHAIDAPFMRAYLGRSRGHSKKTRIEGEEYHAEATEESAIMNALVEKQKATVAEINEIDRKSREWVE
jgi:hypothetical protein